MEQPNKPPGQFVPPPLLCTVVSAIKEEQARQQPLPCAKQSEKRAKEEHRPRIRDEINPEIQTVLLKSATPLEMSDFDLRARQVLHAIHCKGGQEQVRVALGMVASFASRKEGRHSVQNWSAYVGAILRRFFDEFEVQIRAGDDDARTWSWEFKSPASAGRTGAHDIKSATSSSEQCKQTHSKDAWADKQSSAGSSTMSLDQPASKKWWLDMQNSVGNSAASLDQPSANKWWLDMQNLVPPPPPPAPQPHGTKTNTWATPGPQTTQATPKSAQRREWWADISDTSDPWWPTESRWTGKWDVDELKKTHRSCMTAWSGHDSELKTRTRWSLGGSAKAWGTYETERSRRSLPGWSEDASKATSYEDRMGPRQSYGGSRGIWDKERKPRMSLPGSPTKARMESRRSSCGARESVSPSRPRRSSHGARHSVSPSRSWRNSCGARHSVSPSRNTRATRRQSQGASGPAWKPVLANMLQPRLTHKHLEQQLAAWVKLNGHSTSDARIVALSDCGGSSRQVASVLLRGAELLVELEASSGSARHVVVNARTRSAWPALKRSISSALEVASKKPFKEFVDALWLAWPALEEDGEAKQQVPEKETMENKVKVSTPVAIFSIADDEYNVEDAMTDAGGSDAEDTPFRPIGEEQAQELPKTSRTRSFCEWLNNRQPLWRLDHTGDGLAWDFPLSKSEKREFLFLTVAAESNDLRKDNSDLKIEAAALLHEIEFCNMELQKDQS